VGLASELFAQDAVLFVKIFEAGQGNQQQSKGIKCRRRKGNARLAQPRL